MVQIMANIINLDQYKREQLTDRIFTPWRIRFTDRFTLTITLLEFTDETLFALAHPGDNSTERFYEVIMAVLTPGTAMEFHYLDGHQKMDVVDRHLFLADHVRFEIMRRLGWITRYPCQNYSVVEMIQHFPEARKKVLKNAPILSVTQPTAAVYRRLTVREKQVHIRQMLMDALEAFGARLALKKN